MVRIKVLSNGVYLMYVITRFRDDGRKHYCGIRFDGNTIRTDRADVAQLARGLGWDVSIEEATKQEVEAIEESEAEFVCDVCGKEAKSAGGLAAHKRSHE